MRGGVFLLLRRRKAMRIAAAAAAAAIKIRTVPASPPELTMRWVGEDMVTPVWVSLVSALIWYSPG